MIVVGGGVIGVETCDFATLGVAVTLMKSAGLLEFADAEMVEALCYHCGTARHSPSERGSRKRRRNPDHLVVANLKSKKKFPASSAVCRRRQGNVDD